MGESSGWTSTERILAVLSGERPDRVPIFECVAGDNILKHFSGCMPKENDATGVLRTCSKFLDLCHPVLTPRKPGRIELPNGSTLIHERWTSWLQPSPHWQDPPRARSQIMEEIEQAEAYHPTPKELAAWQQQVQERNLATGGMAYIHLGLGQSLLPFDIQHGVLAWADAPDLVRRWNRAVNAAALRDLESRIIPQAGRVAIIWGDIAAKGGLLYSPQMLEELLVPHLREAVELLHSRGIKVIFHSDGNVMPFLDRLVACGIDGFNPLETTAGMDARTFREYCGRRVALVGGVDAVSVLAHGTPAQVAEATRDLIDLYREGGNVIVASASGEIDDSMPVENVLAMYETVREYGRY